MLLQRFLQRIVGFAQRQTPDFRLVWRRALHGVASSLSTQYNSIYATLLGANAVQLGSLESVANAIGALAAVPAGWFISISMALASSMTAEIMPKEQMGRWIGIVSLFRGLLGIPATLLVGLIWKHIGPQHVFFAAIVIDVLLRLPLLVSVWETLHLPSGR